MSYQVGQAPITNPNALRPVTDESQLIKPKQVPNPVKDSKMHDALKRELKVKSRSGNMFGEKSELEKVFHNRKVQKCQNKEVPDERTDIEIELDTRLKQQKAKIEDNEEKAPVKTEPITDQTPEFMKEFMRKKLQKVAT